MGHRPVWLDQLTVDGVLVPPLIMNGATSTIGLVRAKGDRRVRRLWRELA